MGREYVKRAAKTATTGEEDVRDQVAEKLKEIESAGEEAALSYARKLDDWQGDIVVSRDVIADAAG